jgi:hypothetical protein
MNESYRIWVQSLDEYRTNDWHKAYPLLAKAEGELSRRALTQPSELVYDPVLAQMNARLFVLAQKNGDTNAAQQYYEKSAAYYERVLKAGGGLPRKYSPQEVETIVAALDEKLRALLGTVPGTGRGAGHADQDDAPRDQR